LGYLFGEEGEQANCIRRTRDIADQPVTGM